VSCPRCPCGECVASRRQANPGAGKLVALKDVNRVFPDWPYSAWMTGYMARQGTLGCVRIGRRIFMTRELLDAFVERSTVDARQMEIDIRGGKR
jgi:hypothetical protein